MKLKKFPKRSKLRNRFLILFTTLAVVPVLVLGATALYSIDLSHKHDVSQLGLLLAEQKINEIDKFFTDNLGILELTVDIAENQDTIAHSQQQFLLSGFLSSNSAFERVSFHQYPNGRTTAERSKDQGELPPLGYLDPNIAEIVKNRGQHIAEASYASDSPAIRLSTLVHKKDPNTNKAGEPIYIVSADTSLSSLVSSIERAGLGTAGYLILVDEKGHLIAEGSPSDIDRGENLKYLPSINRILANKSIDGLSEEDVYVSPLSDTEVITAGLVDPRTNWAVVVEWPTYDANAILQDMRNRVILFTIATLLAVLVIAPFVASRLINPIRKLENAAKAIEKGDFDTEVDINTGDELEDLGNTFNKMTKGLKRLEELKDEFVFVATHELRSPVTVIKGYLSMLKEGDAGKLPDTASDMINKADMANQRLAQLVNDLLEIARSEAGKLEISVSPVDITEPIQSSVEELQPLADEKSIQLTYENPGNVPQVLAENSRIKEVTVNLVGNAIKYTQEGGWVKVWHEVKDGMVTTHVEDNGFGMSEEAQKKLFQKFYRVQTEKTKSITGTGLGLFIVKQIIEKMNGKIWVESKEGEGSKFSFSLPVAN
ncbi:MAG: sensor histidine kinase [Candidatus Spechtbacterales bacterium]|nr:sensor histidine kinase [Candidatus Spechtbacterales bacterium]